jgi:tRNA (cytidine56-2'-O)-methyltransferase
MGKTKKPKTAAGANAGGSAYDVVVLRLGHRPARDKRITTHVALAARALGASGIIISGEQDEELVARLGAIPKKWGGEFFARHSKEWKAEIRRFGGDTVHLTMYGEEFRKTIKKIERKAGSLGTTRGAGAKRKLMLVVGAGKVPRELYDMCAYNCSVGNQPHSEVAAVALFLYELNGRRLAGEFSGARLSVVPNARGKSVIEH